MHYINICVYVYIYIAFSLLFYLHWRIDYNLVILNNLRLSFSITSDSFMRLKILKIIEANWA